MSCVFSKITWSNTVPETSVDTTLQRTQLDSFDFLVSYISNITSVMLVILEY